MGFGRDASGKILENGLNLTMILGTLKKRFEDKSLAELALIAPVADLRFTISRIKETERKAFVSHVLNSSGQLSLQRTPGISWMQGLFHVL